MSLRRFVNLVMLERKREIYSLRRIDLVKREFFYTTAPPKAQQKLDLKEMERFQIPPTCLNFQPKPCPDAIDNQWKMHSFGVSENKIVFTDNFGVSFLYNAGEPCITTMPALYSPKSRPISLSVFDPEEDGAGSVYVMESVPMPRPDKGQFEAFVYAMPLMYYEKSWERYSLPPPPFVLQPGYKPTPISSYAVLGGGSHLCVSATGIGTYCFDTVSKEWTHVGDWMLPIFGKAEYVPDLGLWFGTSRKDYLPCTSDLSSALNGHEPELRCKWESHFPPTWNPVESTQLVNLGSGRFFTLDYFQTLLPNTYRWGDPVVDQIFAVLSGLELKPGTSSNGSGFGDHEGEEGNDEPQLIFHKSKIFRTDGYTVIDNVL